MRQRTILVVDDSSINRQILRRILASDYDVLEARDGREALDTLRGGRHSVSAVLLDIIMPVMDGYQMLAAMRADSALSQIPVIVTTGDTQLSAEKKALTLGANDFIAKPFDADILRRRLDNLIALRESAALVNALQKDRLTGLWNRETFFEKAAREIEAWPEGYFVLACVDIDNFKLINDQYGTERGDEALIALAGALRKSCAEKGGICGRITADNFVSLYPRALLEESGIGPDALEQDIVSSLNLPVSLSVGRYIVDDKRLSASAMYDRASLARDTVKGRYDARVAVYDESMRSRLVREQEIVNEMNEALTTGQFETWFQPQYNHATGALIGAEALVRWRHPAWGLVSPAEFIPVFERNGFIYELDKYVWEQVCACLRRWTEEDRNPLPVSVNISRYDLFRADLVRTIVGITQKYRVQPDLLRLEITESAFAQSTVQVVNIVRALIDFGFTVEIDDFGSGYSSLNTLKDVPAQVVKLDMRFLESSDNLDRGGNIIESVVRMAKWLGMSVIAEGVETVAQADFLKSIGCNYVQGYLYARPMPMRGYEDLAGGTVKEERLMALQTVENLDNNAFWNPASMDTLIFNSYVGAACIFEYQNGRIELIRATDRYARMLESAGMNASEALKIDWGAHLGEDDRRAVREAIRRSVRTRDEITGDFLFERLPGCPAKIYLRSSLRVIATAGDRFLIYCMTENMTAQREAEARERDAARKERETAERLSLIMNNMSGGISAAVMDGEESHYIFANNQFFAMLGYTPEQFARELPDGLRDIIHPDDIGKTARAVGENEIENGTAALEFRVFKRDGSLMWMRTTGSVCRMEGIAKPVHIAVHTDITAEIAAAQALRNTTEQMRAIMRNMIGGVAAMTVEDGRVGYIFYNERYSGMFGYTPEQFAAELPNGLTDLICAEDLEAVVASARENERAGGVSACEFRARRRDGRVIWVSTSSSVCRFAGVEKPVHVAVLYDITEQRDTIERLRESEERFRIATEMAGVLIGRYDIRTRDYVHNDQTLLSLGYKPVIHDVPQTYIDAGSVAPESAEPLTEFYGRVRAGQTPCSVEARLLLANGVFRWCRVDATVIFDQAGQPAQAIIVTTDIERQRADRAVFDKWRERAASMAPQDYTLFRCNLNRDAAYDTAEGSLLTVRFDTAAARSFDDNTLAYANAFVCPADRVAYIALLHSDTMLAAYHRGRRTRTFDYREMTPDGGERPLRLTVELARNPGSAEVEAFLMYERLGQAAKGGA